jgi:phage tail-like protein
MPTSLAQPATAFNFMVTLWDEDGPFETGSELGGIAGAAVNLAAQWAMGAFSEVEGLDAELEIETYQEGGRNQSPRRFAKVGRYNNLVLKRGVTFHVDLWDWHQQVLSGSEPIIRKGGMIVLFDRNGPVQTGLGLPGLDRLPVASWTFTGGLPERLKGPRLAATSNEVAIETLEISHQGLSRVSLGSIPGLADVTAVFGGALSAGLGGAVTAGIALG